MPLKVKYEKEEEHKHFFKNGQGFCDCGAEMISKAEYDRRLKAYEEYFAKVKESIAYKSYQECRQAFKAEQYDIVNIFAKNARERRLNGELLPKPSFQDPLLQESKFKLLINYGL